MKPWEIYRLERTIEYQVQNKKHEAIFPEKEIKSNFILICILF